MSYKVRPGQAQDQAFIGSVRLELFPVDWIPVEQALAIMERALGSYTRAVLELVRLLCNGGLVAAQVCYLRSEPGDPRAGIWTSAEWTRAMKELQEANPKESLSEEDRANYHELMAKCFVQLLTDTRLSQPKHLLCSFVLNRHQIKARYSLVARTASEEPSRRQAEVISILTKRFPECRTASDFWKTAGTWEKLATIIAKARGRRYPPLKPDAIKRMLLKRFPD